jgi:methionyl-tRNA formyltransferase
MVQAMRDLEVNGTLPSTPQDESLVTYAHKLEKAEAAIDWSKSAAEISRQIRAFNPFPVAQSKLKDDVCRVWMATEQSAVEKPVMATPGEVISIQGSLLVACGQGVLNIMELQAPGGKRMNAQAFIQGHHLKTGDIFSSE